jgi:hypothetical protein
MNHHLSAALAATRQRDLQGAGACCTVTEERRYALASALVHRFRVPALRRRPLAESAACCA